MIELDMEHLFQGKSLCPMKNEKLSDLNKANWLIEVESKPKLRTYMLFKSELSTQDYIKFHSNKRHRSILGQFILGILPLEIETGRFSNVPHAERTCKFCDTDKVEDEYHFVMSCPLYADYRGILFKKATNIAPQFTYYDCNTKLPFQPKTVREIQLYISVMPCVCGVLDSMYKTIPQFSLLYHIFIFSYQK